jgi:hypothetical protein
MSALLNERGTTMAGLLSYYDILGVLPSAAADDVQRSYEAKMAVLAPGMIAGAPSKVITAVDRARVAIELARRTLIDPVARARYDTEIGILRPGSGLARPFTPPSQGLWGWDPSWNRGGAASPGDAAVDLAGVIADWMAPRHARGRHVAVPDARGLFVRPARHLVAVSGLNVDLIQLTRDPMPVEGIVVDQVPPSGATVRRSSLVTMQVWHPSQQHRRLA